MRKILLTLWIMTFSVCVWAEPPVIFDPGKPEFIHSNGKKFPVVNVPLTNEWTHKKPAIAETKILDADEREVVEFSLKENGRRLIHTELKPIKNDYQHDFDRGTVEWTLKAQNYSNHKVTIPDETTIQNTNFSQRNPHTKAIEGKNLTFIECNLTNVDRDSSWILIDSNNVQIKRVLKTQEDEIVDGIMTGRKHLIFSTQLEQSDKTFTESYQDEEIVDSADAVYQSKQFSD